MGFIVKAVKSVVKAVVGVVSKVVGAVFGFAVGSKTTAKAKATNTLNKSLEPEAYRKIIFGRMASPLDLRFWEVWGANGSRYDEVLASAAHRINAYLELYMENDLAISAAGVVQPKFAGLLSRDTRLGAPGQTAMAVGSGTQWTNTATFDGVPHIKLAWVPDEKKLPNGIPSRYTQVTEGALVYDPRRDSTVPGGAGPHRANDRSTWSYATLDGNGVPIGRNNALQALWYLLGWTVPTTAGGEMLVAGRGVDPQDINLASFIAGANACEVAGYYTDMVLSTEDTHTSNEDKITCSGLIGRLIDPGGLWSYYANVDDTANIAVELTDADIIQGVTVNWNEYESMSSQFNQVSGKFVNPSPTTLFQAFPYPMVRDATYEANLGIKRRKPQDFEQVLDGVLAQRLARLLLNQGQYQGEFQAGFNYRALKAQAWSVVRYTSERFGFTKLFRVYRHDISTDAGIGMLLKEIDPSIWGAGTVTPPLAPGLGANYQANQEIPLTGLAVVSTLVKSDATNSTIYDAGAVTWDEPPVVVRRTEVRYRVVGSTYWESAAPVQRGGLRQALIFPLVKSTVYEVQARHISINEVEGPWLALPGNFTSGSSGNVDYQGILTSGITAQWPYVGDPMGTRPENNATVGAPTGTYVAGLPAQVLVGNVSGNTAAISTQAQRVDQIIIDVDNLEAVYGDTASAANSASAALASASAANTAKQAAETARNDSQGARDAAQAARDLALGYRDTANSASSLAAGARDLALGYRNQASSFADNASGSASAAAGSASQANTSASLAGEKASAANASAVQADTSRGQAAASQAAAALSESNASGSASSAASSQSISATARDAAIKAAGRNNPATFEDGQTYFTFPEGGITPSFFVYAGKTYYQFSATTYGMVRNRFGFPTTGGRVVRFRANVQKQDGPAGLYTYALVRFAYFDGAGGVGGRHVFFNANSINLEGNGQSYQYTADVTVPVECNSLFAELLYVNNNFVATAPITYVGDYFGFTDVTSEVASLASASASALSASQASASNTAAGQQAQASQTAKVAAEAARDAAQGSASAASGSASTASASATLAGQRADAAQSSAQQADTARGQAQAAQASAAQSESNAAGSASSAAQSQSLTATARDVATGARDAAIGARDAANASASAASGSASSAAASQSDALQKANAAESARQAAVTAKGQAESARDSAATSKSDAAGSASTASTQASLSASARQAAQKAAGRNNPATFEDGGAYFTFPEGVVSGPNFPVYGGKTYYQIVTDTYGMVRNRYGFPTAGGRKVRFAAKIQKQGGVTNLNSYCFVRFMYFDGPDGTGNRYQFYQATPAALIPNGNTIDYIRDVDVSAAVSQLFAEFIVVNDDFRPSSLMTWVGEYFSLEDVTSEVAASGSASAASTSASAASASAGTAGNQATIATQARQDAQAANGAAQTAASNSAGSASSASASAASAATSTKLNASLGLSLLANPRMIDYPNAGGLPNNWISYGNPAYRGVGIQDGTYSAEFNAGPGAASGIGAIPSYNPGLNQVRPGYYVVEVDLSLRAGGLTYLQYLVQALRADGTGLQDIGENFTDVPDQTGTPPGYGSTGRLYSFRRLVYISHPETVKANLYVISFGGDPNQGKHPNVYYANLRPATESEIKAKQAADLATSLSASVSSNSATIATLQGRALAYWQNTTNAGAAGTFIEARSESSFGAGATSTVSIGAREIHLFNQAAANTYSRALSVAGGRVIVYGDLDVGGAMRFGTRRIPVALQSFSVSASDGQAVSFGGDLTNLPKVEPQATGLPSLPSGQSYDIKALSLTSTGFTTRAKIITQGTPSNQNSGAGTNTGGTPAYRAQKPSAGDAVDGNYNFFVSGQVRLYVYGNQYQQQLQYDDGGNTANIYVDCYVKRNGNWQAIGQLYTSVSSYGSGGSGMQTFYWDASGAVYFADAIGQDAGGDYEFGIDVSSDAGALQSISFGGVTYQAQGSQTGETAVPQAITFRIIPQNG